MPPIWHNIRCVVQPFLEIQPDGKCEMRWVTVYKSILAEVLNDMREMGVCYVKYEKNQSCFHITARWRPICRITTLHSILLSCPYILREGYQYYMLQISDSNNTNITIKEVGTHLRSNLLLLFYLEAILTNQRKLQGYYCSSLISSPSSPSL